ncbi:hypothetical protein [Streptomyces beigongshangae]|uniref:hypothetical protein n=1 Tax=Streptomyces beigongshangae TaxID=2841597 RepID=UPI001C85468A|nr:hypothetical protein [Streptomyces sp. REN17]
MQYKALLFVLVVQASVIVGLLAGILQFAEVGQLVGAVRSGGAAFGGAMVLGMASITWLWTS